MNKKTSILILLLLAPTLLAQTRGDKLGPKPASAEFTVIEKGMGKTWAVLIANSAYTRWPDLEEEPYQDVSRIKRVLEDYSFAKVRVIKDLKVDNFEKTLEDIYHELVENHVQSLLI